MVWVVLLTSTVPTVAPVSPFTPVIDVTVAVCAMPHGSESVMLSPHAEMHAGPPAQLHSQEPPQPPALGLRQIRRAQPRVWPSHSRRQTNRRPSS